jgi:hypothetical protein
MYLLFPEQDFYKAETNYQNYRGSSHLKIQMDGNTYASLPCIAGKIKRFRWFALAPLKLLFTSCST